MPRVQPGASREGVEGPVALPDGQVALAVRVCAPPEDGRANAALVKLLAKTWKLPKSAFTIAGGGKSRRKLIHIAGDPGTLRPQLDRWIEAHHG